MDILSALVSFLKSVFGAKNTETPKNVIILKGETTVIDSTFDTIPAGSTANISLQATDFFKTFDFGSKNINPVVVVANPGYQSVLYVTTVGKNTWVSPPLVGQLETQNFQVSYLENGMNYFPSQYINCAINYAKSGVLELLPESVCAKGVLYSTIPKSIRPIKEV